jgi:3-oxoacyl-[acyl-carrier-protein] synthase-3
MVGVATYVPTKVLTNADFERMVDTSDEWIRERTGISERHIAGDGETLASMGADAVGRLFAEQGVTADAVDALIVGTATWDRLLPSAACDLQAAIGAKNAAAFDVSAACSGFLYGLSIADAMVAAGRAETVLVVGAERLSSITDYGDRATSILFGDAAGATLVRKADGDGSGILSTFLKSDGTLGELLYRPGRFPVTPEQVERGDYFLRMAGREVFKAAVRSMAEACDAALERAGLDADAVDLLIPHQANVRIIEATAKRTGIPMDRVLVNIDRYGNTSAASVPLALDEAVRSGRVEPGMTVLMVAFGGGFTWASALVRW